MIETRWKFLRTRNGKIVSEYGFAEWTVGKLKTVTGVIRPCVHGFHSSPTILAALDYVKGEVLAQVEALGDSVTEDDKSAHRSMKIVRAYRWTKRDSVQLAVFAAELVLYVFESAYPGDERPRQAIAAAKVYLESPLYAPYPAYDAYDAYDASGAPYAAYDAYGTYAAAGYAAYAAAYAYDAAYGTYADDPAYEGGAGAAAFALAAAHAAEIANGRRHKIREHIEDWLHAHVGDLEEIEEEAA